MSCLTTSATRRSRSVPAAVLIASAAASSHDVLLVPMISVTRYTLITLSLDHARPRCGAAAASLSHRHPARPGSPAAGWFVVDLERWATVVVVLASAGDSLFRGWVAGSTQGGRRGRGGGEGAVGNPADLFCLAGQVALVTGAGSGLGRQFSEV